MKKSFYLFSLLLLFVACQKDPDLSKLDNDFPVLTDHDNTAKFSNYNTYYIPDSVLVIDGTERGRYWTDNDADNVITAFVNNMNTRGYTRVYDKDDADLGLQVSYIENVNYFYGYYDDYYYDYPYWWGSYPGYWGPGYWGGWGGWYYPYRPVVYSYNTGSLLAEMIDLDANAPTGNDAKLPVIWTAYMGGLLSSSDRVNVQLAIQGVNQAFDQSQYIKR